MKEIVIAARVLSGFSGRLDSTHTAVVGRAKDIAFAIPSGCTTAISKEALEQIGKGDAWQKTHAETERLVRVANKTLRACQKENDHFGSVAHWRTLCDKVVALGDKHLDSESCVGKDREAVEAVVDEWMQDIS